MACGKSRKGEEEEMRWKEAQGSNRIESPSSSSFARTAPPVIDLIGRRDLVTGIERHREALRDESILKGIDPLYVHFECLRIGF
jgi:hypothetical protein